MAKNNYEQNPTTVRLTEKAQFIKEDLAPVFGLKNILSAGLLVFGKLTTIEQKVMIQRANGSLETEPLQNPDDEFRKKVTEICQELGVLQAKKKPCSRTKSTKSGK